MMILASILGFLGPFIPELLKWFNRKQDNAHELAMLEMSAKLAEKQAGWRMEEARLRGQDEFDVQDLKRLSAPQVSFGVQLLDAAQKTSLPFWVVWPVFWAFAFADWLNSTVRPSVTYWVVGFYLYYKWALLQLAEQSLSKHEAIVSLWTQDDLAVLFLCLGYFFGQRAAKAAFGGSASTGRVGGG